MSDLRCWLGILMAAAAVGVPPAVGAQQRNWEVSVGAGPSLPVGKLADEARRGFHVQGSAGYRLPSLPITLRTDLFYQNFSAVPREPGLNASYGGEWYRQLSLLLNVAVQAPAAVGEVRAYGLIGGGWIREWHDDRTYWTDEQSTLNFNVGVGAEFPVLGATGFVEARYLNLFGGEALPTRSPAVYPEVQFRSVPVTVGVRF